MDCSFGCDTNKLVIVHTVHTYQGVSGYSFIKYCIFCLNIIFNFTNSVDPDEMQHHAAFHMGFLCLQKYRFGGYRNTKGLGTQI